MAYRYPRRFRLTGRMEFTYQHTETLKGSDSYSTTDERTDFTQRYTLGLSGYVYDPRLMVFTSLISFMHTNIWQEGNEGILDALNYDISTTLLPYRPLSLTTYASKTDSTVEGTYLPQFTVTSLSYGAYLRINMKKLPLIRLDYRHWEYDSELETGTTERDSYGFNVWGNVKALRMRYILNAELSDYKSPQGEYNTTEIRLYQDFSIKKETSLKAYSYYSGREDYKLFNLDLDLEVNPLKRLRHDYSYGFNHTSTDLTEADTHRLRAGWTYKFNNYLTGSFSVNAGFSKLERDEGEEEGTSEGIGAGLSYVRRISWFDTRTYWRGSYSHREGDETDSQFNGEVILNNLGTNIVMRRFSFATIYTGYDFTDYMRDGGELISHFARLGISGRGPKRAYWRLEGNYRVSEGDETTSDEEGTVRIQEGRSYAIRGEFGYPISYRGLIAFNTGYNVNEADSDRWDNLYYTIRANYLLVRNLHASGWWSQSWSNDAERTDMNGTFSLRYRFRRVYITAEYRFRETEELSDFSRTQSILLKLTRVIW